MLRKPDMAQLGSGQEPGTPSVRAQPGPLEPPRLQGARLPKGRFSARLSRGRSGSFRSRPSGPATCSPSAFVITLCCLAHQSWDIL